MNRIYTVEPFENLHDKLFRLWETHCHIGINNYDVYNTCTSILAYDTENDVYEIYRKSDANLEHPRAVYKACDINTIETYV